MEKFLDCEKLTFLTAEKVIGLITLKVNSDFETMKTYLLDLEPKLRSLVFFGVGKVNIIFSRRLKHKY